MSLSSSRTPVFIPSPAKTDEVSRSPSLQGSLNHIATADFLNGVPGLHPTGWMEFQPSGIRLQLLDGDIIGASGCEPLGTILLRRGELSEIDLSQALKLSAGLPLGEVLLNNSQFRVSREALFEAMKTQILLSVNQLILKQQSYFAYYRDDKLPSVYTRVSVQWALLESITLADEIGVSELGLSTVLKSRPNSSLSGVSLSGDEWQILTAVNGRRSLQAVLKLFAADATDSHGSWLRGYRAALRLYRQGLLELAAVMGLRTIILERVRSLSAAYHPPAGMVANLFIKMLDGSRDVYTIGEELRLEPDKTAQIIVSLFRDKVATVKQGQSELEKLLDEY